MALINLIKRYFTKIFFLLISCILFISCSKNNVKKEVPVINNNNIDSSLELKKRELDFRERDLELKEKMNESSQKKESENLPKFSTYNNPRFEYSVSYPDNVTYKFESDNGGGCTFKINNEFEMLVWGNYFPSVENKNIKEIFQDEINNHTSVTYKSLKSNWFVISGFSDNDVYYIKYFVINGSSKVLQITYDKSLKYKYDKYTEIISNSFTSF